jgi:hypothetical protein
MEVIYGLQYLAITGKNHPNKRLFNVVFTLFGSNIGI